MSDGGIWGAVLRALGLRQGVDAIVAFDFP